MFLFAFIKTTERNISHPNFTKDLQTESGLEIFVTKLFKLLIGYSLDTYKFNEYVTDIFEVGEKLIIKAKSMEVEISPKMAELFKI